MRTPDLDRARSEQTRTPAEFLREYNEHLPDSFPRASAELLREFRASHKGLFKAGTWSLDLHRKKLMDWLRSRAV